MKQVGVSDLKRWWSDGTMRLDDLRRSIGREQLDPDYLEETLGLPLHLAFLARVFEEGDDLDGTLSSIPYYSLCKGLFLPLSRLSPDRIGHLFGIEAEPPLDVEARETLLQEFLEKRIGLTLMQKLGCLLGDPFRGETSGLRRDSLLRLLQSVTLTSRRDLLDRLRVVGDVAILFAENRGERKGDPPLTAVEVLETLHHLPDEKRSFKFDLLRSLLARCGRMEAYFLSKLILRKAGFGFDYEGPLLARLLAGHFEVPADQVAHAMTLTDAWEVTRILTEEGAEGLRRVRLQPLVPVRPCLAGGTVESISEFPVRVERKYDGIRLMLHKSTDRQGSILCGAYTRTRRDWLELIPGLDATIKMLPAPSFILDGELHGTVLDGTVARPATVYEVHASLRGDGRRPVNLRFAAFDILYLNGRDLTSSPLSERREHLDRLVRPASNFPLPIPIGVAEGQLANDRKDLNRLYQHFRAQGYEGIMAKKPESPYRLAMRDGDWAKRKPEVTLDLVLLGAVYAVTQKERAGMFGSYVIGARTAEGVFEDVGDVAGVDTVRDAQIQAEIMREGLLTGRRIERQSASGTRPGLELRPHIVVTIKFEGVVRDAVTKKLSLRSPKLVVIRSDKSPYEADTLQDIEALHLKQRMG